MFHVQSHGGVGVGSKMGQVERGGEGTGSVGRGNHTLPAWLFATPSIMVGKSSAGELPSLD